MQRFPASVSSRILVRGLLLLPLVVGVVAGPALAQVSPGALAEAHASLEGNANCVKCHGAREAGLDVHCRDCHVGVDALIEAGRGLHAATLDTSCGRCHPDHAGRDFELIEFEAEGFDHAEAGWSLEGSHRVVECRECHTVELQRDPVAALMKTTDRAGSWTGLATDCLSCHGDFHQGQLPEDCTDCHSSRKWKPAPSFDHARAAFALEGKHVEVGCEKCHAPLPHPDARWESTPRYQPVAHDSCVSCHRDAHEGRMGDDCSSCHTPADWHEVTLPDGSRFDHSRTRFPLRGGHRAVACESCHRTGPERIATPRFDRCDACHADAHAGTATLGGRVTDCGSCHDERAFSPSTYSVEQHARADYPLEGGHRQVACRDCHRTAEIGTARVELRPASARCTDCHADSHAGQLEIDDCASCHAVDGWKPSSFDVERHAGLAFSLHGAHAETACSACHGPARPGLAPLPVRATKLGTAKIEFAVEQQCAACHLDPHGEGLAEESCDRCHSPARFAPSAVDAALHAELGFTLAGAHAALPCIACHEELGGRERLGDSRVRGAAAGRAHWLTFAASGQDCVDCHETPHGDQFDAGCDSCHSSDLFVPAEAFDHDRDTEFPLAGGHIGVACAKCHETIDGIVRYRETPSVCRDCHAPGSVEPGGA